MSSSTEHYAHQTLDDTYVELEDYEAKLCNFNEPKITITRHLGEELLWKETKKKSFVPLVPIPHGRRYRAIDG